MKYSEIKSKIKSGDIIALSHYKWASWYDFQVQMVRVFTQSEFTHVGLVWEVAGRLFVIEAVEPVVRITPLSHCAEEGFYWAPLNTPISDEELEFALSKVGKAKYSKWQAIKSQFKSLKVGEDDLFECAEFVICARKLSGVNLGDVATPSEVVKAAQESGSPLYFVN